MKITGNFIKQMFIYEYTNKNGVFKSVFGIHEVVQGPFAQKRAEKKHETHIEKLLAYPIKNRWNKELSHFSLQGHCTYLNKQKRNLRTEELDDRYYPFTLEFESRKKKEQYEVALEAAQYIQYLIYELDVNEEDIVIIINNSKSIYVMINPKTFNLKPGKNLHRIYTDMYRTIKENVSLNFVDESVVNSSYRLIKTPGSYYKGGYVNYITVNELMEFMTGQNSRARLTKKQRDIRKLVLPSITSFKMTKLYENSKRKIEKALKNNKKVLSLPGASVCNKECVKALIDMPLMEKGNRNNFLVTIALGLKEANYSKKEILEILERKAIEWRHDESLRAVCSKYKSILNNNTNFSCDKVKMLFEEEGLKLNCKSCGKAINSIYISRKIIESIYNNKGAMRHFRLYLELEKGNLLDKYFSLEEAKINERALKELVKKTGGRLEKKDGLHRVIIKRENAIYRLPIDYIDKAFDILKQKIGKVLMLIVKSYSGNEYGAFISLDTVKIAEYLAFKSERSAYNFLNNLEKLGFLTKNKNGFTVYYKSRKVINLEEVKETKRVTKEELEKLIEEKKVANGTQLKFNFEKLEASTNIKEEKGEIYILSKTQDIKHRRGSPP